MKCALSYGANAYTLHVNQNIPMEEAQKIEDSFKELHTGVYTWGDRVYERSIKTGFITSTDGWRLKLPEYEKFKILKEKIETITSEQWQRYRQGKFEYKALKADRNYKIKIQQNYDFYKERKKGISDFFKLKSEYQRLCLNNPIQSCGSHMTKRAVLILFEWILKNNLLWRVKICNVPHDEIVAECEESLKEITRDAVEKSMIEGGNHYLSILTIKADAAYADNWESAKHN